MIVYRIVNDKKRSNDLSGMGAFKFGGRWNYAGVYALYCSEHEALCMLELLVHVAEEDLPDTLYIMEIKIDDKAPIKCFTEKELPANWRIEDNLLLKNLGTLFFRESAFLGMSVPSAVLPQACNYILSPQYQKFSELVTITKVVHYNIDGRLRKAK